ncbi:MAG: hypothetical protein ACFBSG_09205 [Leptolyngbyaceae cyanobacterium]
MKLQLPGPLTFDSTNDSPEQPRLRLGQRLRRSLLTSGGLTLAVALPSMATSLLTASTTVEAVAQALPTPLPPLPASSGAPATGEQYLVLINGSSDLLLQQVRQVEPGAFVNYVDGRSMIQAGRFSSYQNAQARANELASFGLGAEVQATDFAGAPIALAPPADYDLAFPTPTSSTVVSPSMLPSNTVAATPSSIEFGEAAPFQSPVPPSTAAFPPPDQSSAFPGTVSPPVNNTTAPPPLAAPTFVDEGLPSGYYVVVPGNAIDLPNIANQVIALGAPNSLVRTRTSPRGPHVAVGPYNDRGIAQEWSGYLRDSGITGSRVHFE